MLSIKKIAGSVIYPRLCSASENVTLGHFILASLNFSDFSEFSRTAKFRRR